MLYTVMDGCTMADESYFASTLVKKILRKIAQTKTYQEFNKQAEQLHTFCLIRAFAKRKR